VLQEYTCYNTPNTPGEGGNWAVDSQKKIIKMLLPDVRLEAKMHQNRFRLGLRPHPAWKLRSLSLTL